MSDPRYMQRPKPLKIPNRPQAAPVDEYPIEPPTPLERIGRGMVDVGQAANKGLEWTFGPLQQYLGITTPEEERALEQRRADELELYNRGVGAGGGGVNDVWRDFGRTAALGFIPHPLARDFANRVVAGVVRDPQKKGVHDRRVAQLGAALRMGAR